MSHIEILLNVFQSENIVLFTVTSIHCIEESIKNRESETKWNTKWKATGNSRLKQVKQQRDQVDKVKKFEGK